ncbi:uncharacterized protein L201_004231 [Kwoniella dendrophila CBS 6074]|uniref:DNA repair protein REV1 n=1 Tax=Kwoniella dendrophila CBS 6074 TaxID=1295534 RepID=A0AAX4JXQ8_9TREE
MSQQNGTPPPSTSSTFPMSSPSFWTEAAAVALPSPPTKIKRPREELSSPQSDYTTIFQDVTHDDEALEEVKPEIKRGRYDSPSKSSSTTLSYLPKRSDFLDLGMIDDPHSYLSNPEYAPNKFGDIGDYMRKKEIKVQTQNRDIALASAKEGIKQIFNGLSFYINGNTNPPMEELRKLILQRGGEVRPVLRNKGMVKFIIAPMLTQSKFNQFKNYKVVREGWITQSCKENKLLDWTRWKLQIIGGWEENSRKGMEGFFKSQQIPSQQEFGDELEPSQNSTEDTKEEVLQSTPAASDTKLSSGKVEIPEALQQTLPPIQLSTATQSLLAPYRPSTIPINPLKSPQPSESLHKQESPSPAPPLPAKAQKSESPWEFYHSKESNENAAQALKNDQWRIKNTAERGNEGGFIDGYYQNSRLHHLATWKSELKVLVADAQKRSEELSLSIPSSETISPFSFANSALPSTRNINNNEIAGGISEKEKVIFHVDFDCFFVSCGLATRPHLKGKPTVVCHSQAGKNASSTSEIASCSYEARAKGVKNGMSLGRARTLVGDGLQTIPYEFDTYKKYSLAFYTVLMGYADDLQAVSVDEALIDVTSAVNARAMAPEEAIDESEHVSGVIDDRFDNDNPLLSANRLNNRQIKRVRDPAVEVAEKIRDEVRKLTDGCEVSIGISHNILLSKLATRSAKPAGVAHLLHEDVSNFLAPLDVEDFPSIGYSIKSKIEEKFGSSKVSELLNVNKLSFQRVLGPKTGEMLFGYLRGIDERKLEPDKIRKSISAEMNYGIRFKNSEQAEICVNDLAAEVAKRMKNLAVKGRQITLKLMKRHAEAPVEPPKFLGHGWCEAFNKSAAISGPRGNPTDDPDILGREAVKLLRILSLDPVELRGVGIQVTKLDTEDKDKVKEREAGQRMLSFQTKPTPKPSAKEESAQVETPRFKKIKETINSPIQEPEAHKKTLSRSPSRSPSVHERASKSPTPQPEAGPSRLPTDDSQEGIDPSFLAALPASLQEEVKRDHARTRAQTRSTRAASEKLVSNAPTDTTQNRATTVSPVKKQHSVAHITKQLRPKMKTQMKSNQLADRPLFSAWNKAQEKDEDDYEFEVVDLSKSDPKPAEDHAQEKIGGYKISEIKELGLDPEVVEALPEDMRKEIIEEERMKQGRRKSLLKPGNGFNSNLNSREKGIIRSRQSQNQGFSSRYSRGLSYSASPTKGGGSRSGSLPPLPNGNNHNLSSKEILKYTIKKSNKPALFKSTEIQDILNVIEKWIESRNGNEPNKKDIDKVKNWLLKSINSSTSLIGGLERCLEMLRFMRTILREKFPLQEDYIIKANSNNKEEEKKDDEIVVEDQDADGDVDDEISNENKVGKIWWKVWKGYKDEFQSRSKQILGSEMKI